MILMAINYFDMEMRLIRFDGQIEEDNRPRSNNWAYFKFLKFRIQRKSLL